MVALAPCSFADNNKPKSTNGAKFDGKRFYNLDPTQRVTFKTIWQWRLNRRDPNWPTWVQNGSYATPPTKVAKPKAVRITFINHATVLLQYDGINVLTDPIWSERASPVRWAGPKRVRYPGIAWSDLPRIAVVIISHNHYDHMDLSTLKQLEKRDHPIFIAGLGSAKTLRRAGLHKVISLDWWQSYHYDGHRFTFVPAQHFSNRSLNDYNRTLWGGFVLSSSAGNLYFAGDTAWGSHFKRIKQRVGKILFAMLPIGAYLPRNIMKHSHVNPEEAVKAFLLLKCRWAIGVHFDTFANLTDEPFNQAPKELAKSLKKHQVKPSRFRALGFGQSCWITKKSMACASARRS